MQWACQHSLSHAAMNDLLKLLKKQNMDVPTCAKTLLKTPRECRDIAIQSLSGGDFVYIGLQNGLLSLLESSSRERPLSGINAL
jgi:hypothetical protein